MKKLKIYIATPVNARQEPLLVDRKKEAIKRCEVLRKEVGERFPNADVVTSFDVCPLSDNLEESVAMGRCVALLMSCDAIYLDEGWKSSKGCSLEYQVATIYGLHIMGHVV